MCVHIWHSPPSICVLHPAEACPGNGLHSRASWGPDVAYGESWLLTNNAHWFPYVLAPFFMQTFSSVTWFSAFVKNQVRVQVWLFPRLLTALAVLLTAAL